MKILQIIPRFTMGGAERLVLEYAKRLLKPEFEVRVASVRQTKTTDYRLRTTDYIDCSSGSFWMAMKRLRALVWEWRPEIIHTHIFSSDVAGYFLKRSFPRLKWVSTQHNVARQHSFWRRLVLRCILRRADQVIAVSPRVVGKILIPNAIALEPWLAVPIVGLLTNKTLRLATIGRLEKQKGIDILLGALARMKDINWHLSIFGVGNLAPKLKKQARQLGIEEYITWPGAVSDLPHRLRDIDIVIQASRWEGMSLAVMEALAAGRIVIASEAAGEGLIEHLKTGIIIKAELSNTLRWINEHREKARQIAERGRRYATEHFGMDAHLRRLAELYRDLGGRPLDRRK